MSSTVYFWYIFDAKRTESANLSLKIMKFI